MTRAILLGAVALALSACGLGEGIGSWRDAAFGLAVDDEEDVLSRILESAEDTPGSQGLLYVAIVDAEAASQGATRAVALADDRTEVVNALGEVVFAIQPAEAPDWQVKGAGLVPGWNGTGYGLIPAVEDAAAGLRLLSSRDGAVGERAGEALICVENTLGFARQALDLAQTVFVDAGQDDPARLEEIQRLAEAQLYGVDLDGDEQIDVASGECALRQTTLILEQLRLEHDI